MEIKTLKIKFQLQLRRFFTTVAIFYLRKHDMQKNETPTKRIFYHFGENQHSALLDTPQSTGHPSVHNTSLGLPDTFKHYRSHLTLSNNTRQLLPFKLVDLSIVSEQAVYLFLNVRYLGVNVSRKAFNLQRFRLCKQLFDSHSPILNRGKISVPI